VIRCESYHPSERRPWTPSASASTAADNVRYLEVKRLTELGIKFNLISRAFRGE
jgi:hypothetical protein